MQNRRSGELPSGPLKTYKMMLDLMDVIFTILQQIWLWKKNCPCTSNHHGIPHWKCVLRCSDKCPSISITHKDTNKNATDKFSKTRFHVYHNVSRCTVHDIHPY